MIAQAWMTVQDVSLKTVLVGLRRAGGGGPVLLRAPPANGQMAAFARVQSGSNHVSRKIRPRAGKTWGAAAEFNSSVSRAEMRGLDSAASDSNSAQFIGATGPDMSARHKCG